jgi:hypothetical protein
VPGVDLGRCRALSWRAVVRRGRLVLDRLDRRHGGRFRRRAFRLADRRWRVLARSYARALEGRETGLERRRSALVGPTLAAQRPDVMPGGELPNAPGRDPHHAASFGARLPADPEFESFARSGGGRVEAHGRGPSVGWKVWSCPLAPGLALGWKVISSIAERGR